MKSLGTQIKIEDKYQWVCEASPLSNYLIKKVKRIQNQYFKNLNLLIRLQRKIKSYLKQKKQTIKIKNGATHRPNQSSIRLKPNRMSISNTTSQEFAFNYSN